MAEEIPKLVTDEYGRRWIEYPDGRRAAFMNIVQSNDRAAGRRADQAVRLAQRRERAERMAAEGPNSASFYEGLEESLFSFDD